MEVQIVDKQLKTPRQIIPQRLSDQVEHELLSLLQSGEYVPGDRLPSERELMELFDVGRSSIREALFTLQRKGFIQINRGDRPRVIELRFQKMIAEFTDVVSLALSKPNGILQFTQFRSLFEASIARFATENGKPEDISLIEAALQANMDSTVDFEAFRKTDIAFHRAIAEATHNPVIVGVYDALVEWVISKRLSDGNLEKRVSGSVVDHKRIFKQICAGDPDEAYKAMFTHISQANSEYDLLS